MAYLLRDLDNGHFIIRDVGSLQRWENSMVELAREAYFAKQPKSQGGKGARVLVPMYYDSEQELRYLTRDEQNIYDAAYDSIRRGFEQPSAPAKAHKISAERDHRVAYIGTGARKVLVDGALSLSQAISARAALKRRGFTAWVERADGTFVPVKGATRLPAHVTGRASGYAEGYTGGADVDRLFIGIYPGGVVYSDRKREEHGDYKRLAFLPYDTLKLDMKKGVPAALAAQIRAHAAMLKPGTEFKISASGQTVMLGTKHGRTSGSTALERLPAPLRKPAKDFMALGGVHPALDLVEAARKHGVPFTAHASTIHQADEILRSYGIHREYRGPIYRR